jgi:hypothetical protein
MGKAINSLFYFEVNIMTKLELLVDLMSDGGWHSTDDLVCRVGHRFSATKYVAEKQGYQFDSSACASGDRRRNGQIFEYLMVVGLAVGAST